MYWFATMAEALDNVNKCPICVGQLRKSSSLMTSILGLICPQKKLLYKANAHLSDEEWEDLILLQPPQYVGSQHDLPD